MGPLVAIGGVHVPEESVKPLEDALEAICGEFGFPQGQEFKWSPGRRLWMRRNLVDARREEFFRRVLQAAQGYGVQAVVVGGRCRAITRYRSAHARGGRVATLP